MKNLKLGDQIFPVESEYFPVDLEGAFKNLSKLKGTFELKVIFFGTPQFVIPILKALDECFNLTAVVTGPDQIQGRKKVLTPTSVNLWTQKNAKQALVFTPDKLDEESFIKYIKALEPDLFVVAAFGKIIPQAVLDIPKFGSLNVHPSLLPKYRGATPIQSAILAGDKKTGISIIKMDDKMDHGPIVYQETFRLSQKDTLDYLHNKLFQRSAEILPEIIKDFVKGKIKLKSQNNAIATYCYQIKREDGYFDVNNLPDGLPEGSQGRQVSPEFLEKLDRMIRAYYPWPTAWTKWNGKVVKFLPNSFVQIEGKKPVNFKEFLNGYPDFPKIL